MVWVKKFRSVLIATLHQRPATHELRVTCHGCVDDRVLSTVHSKLLRQLRRQTTCEYWAINEWSAGKRHLHVLARTEREIPAQLVGELWRKAMPGESLTHHAAPVRDQMAIAVYLAKLAELPPESFTGRLFSASRGFFPKSVTKLMKEKRGA